MSWPVKEATDSIYNSSIIPIISKSNTYDENISTGQSNQSNEAATRGKTTKSQKYQVASERFFTEDISKIFGVPKSASKSSIAPIVSQMSEVVKVGKADPTKMDELFNKAYGAGVVEMDDYYNQYKGLKDELMTNPISLSSTAKANIADYNDFKKHNFKNVKISDDGVPVDVKYAELSERHPNLFPTPITDETEQVEHIADVVRGIFKV